ncbi:hypothetical protein HK104_009417 [Borealophlyctis nickersoniae]|nr:hypothetical protein HK104_009417 [Borealophlyctis nickersoniae]
MSALKSKGSKDAAEQQKHLNILLTNGRFPVSLDLARQLKASGHTVYVVDPMKYHVCRFSNSVKRSWHVPAPHVDAQGYVEQVQKVVREANIDLIIPLHEEVFHLAQRCRNIPDVLNKLFAAPYDLLISLHNKWYFYKILRHFNLDAPETLLCKTLDDVKNLDRSQAYALKAVFGRAKSNMFHLKPNDPLPDNLQVDADHQYVAQVWLTGKQYCTYAIARNGKMLAFGVYPVQDTVDGSSCVYFQSIDHPGIEKYMDTLIRNVGYTGQMALDFIETEDRLVAIECNPRATSGIHLFHRDQRLPDAFISNPTTSPSPATAPGTNPESRTFPMKPKQGAQRQLFPGMIMWHHSHISPSQYFVHLRHLVTTRDVIFSWRDLLPSLMQPFLVGSYYEICRERKMKLGEMFQWDLTWELAGEELRDVDRMLEEWNEKLENGGGVEKRGAEGPVVGVMREDVAAPIMGNAAPQA